jgi:hypothetical protein
VAGLNDDGDGKGEFGFRPLVRCGRVDADQHVRLRLGLMKILGARLPNV